MSHPDHLDKTSVEKSELEVAFENAVVNKFHSDCAPELLGCFAATFDEASFKQALVG
jgi:hypothetical protein